MLVSPRFTFVLLAHRFLRASPTVTWRILHFKLLLSKICSFPLGIAPTPVPFFLPANSLPILTRYNLPGLGHCSYPVGWCQTQGFDFSPPPFPWGLSSLELLRPGKLKYVEEDSEF